METEDPYCSDGDATVNVRGTVQGIEDDAVPARPIGGNGAYH